MNLTPDEEYAAFTYMFLYMCYTLTNEKIDYVHKRINEFLATARNSLSVLGISKKEIDEVAGKLFPNASKFVEMFKQAAYNEISFNDSFLHTVLFDDPTQKLVQKIYEENKMHEFNIDVMIEYCKTWVFKIKDVINKIKTSIVLKKPSYKADNTLLLNFFEKVWKEYCPVNGSHKFEKDKCKFCGIYSNGKNIPEVFEKNMDKISNTYTFEDHNTTNFEIKSKLIIDISKYAPTDLFKVYIKGISPVLESRIMETLKTHPEKVQQFLSTVLHTDKFDIKDAPRLLCYILDKNLVSVDTVSANLLYTCAPIGQFVWV